MKTIKLILFFAIFCYCLSDEIDCETEFNNLLKDKCEEINFCSYNPNDPNKPCVEIHECQTGTESNCSEINPPNYLSSRCVYDYSTGTCISSPRECYNYRVNCIIGLSCTSLLPPNHDQRCILMLDGFSPDSCQPNFKDCTKIKFRYSDECTINIPESFTDKCVYNGGTSCTSALRYCEEGDKSFVNYFGKDKCRQLPVSGTTDEEKSKKSCIYNGEKCKEEFKQCQDQTVSSEDQCEDYTPLNNDYSNYDYSEICTNDASVTSGIKCKARRRKCTEYTLIPSELLNEDICEKLETSETYYRCAYNEEDNECYEEYDTCESYITNKVETERSDCEGIVLKDKNKKCVYNQKEDKCITIDIYPNCEAYQEKDKKICESILSSDNHQYCILDKDSKCIEKPINCDEAHTDKEMCLKIAKASNSNKRCAFGYAPPSYSTEMCYEEYIRCEDYIGTSGDECERINLYDGKKCKWESSSGATGTNINRCRSAFKTCEDAKTKEECKLIAKTGVTDPDTKVCDWIGSSCEENYKYCSDYRGSNGSVCSNIKPYDESGEQLDIGFKCIIVDNDVGCEKVPLTCEDAGESRSLCESYSQYIKDNDKKFCVFDKPNDPNNECCHSHYKKCEYIKHSSELSSCSTNIIEGYIEGACVEENNKCVTKDICSKIWSTYNSKKDFFIKRFNANCSFTSDGKFKYTENSFNEITFYSNNSNNKEICENMQASKPYKKCSLKEDQTGCEEVYKEYNYSTVGISYSTSPEASSQGNSSGFIEKGLYLILSLLCLLI